MRNKVLIGPSTFAALDSSPADKLIDAGFEVVNNPFGRKLTVKELMNLLSGVTGLIAGLENLNREVMEGSDLKVISRCGSGMSNVDLKAAEELGIMIFSTPDGPTTSVAELTVGLLLSMIRLLYKMNMSMHQRKWNKQIGTQLNGKVVAIVGFGRIGRTVCRLLKAFEADVVAVDPSFSGVVDGTQILSLEDALKKADIIILHCSDVGVLLGEDEFKLMKEGVYLLNVARGNLIDEASLIHALEGGHVAGACLDSFTEEPYNGPLCDYEQVILTPHIGSYTYECRRLMEMESVENLLKGLNNS
jgi:D-3-phosphoglycerate dehydrogenase